MAMPPPPIPSPFRGPQKRPSSVIVPRMSPRSNSRQSLSSRPDSGAAVASSRTSEDDSSTAVKVAIRVRPPLQPADPGYDLIPQRFRGSTCEVTAPSSISIQSSQGRKVFVFDKVFGQEVDQAGVWDYIKDGVDSFVQGYNVSILAYGQSGAGKSFTMGTSDPEDLSAFTSRGIVPRAAAALFEKLPPPSLQRSALRSPQRYSTQGVPTLQSLPRLNVEADKSWQLKATYVEIYNEQLRDLLLDEAVPFHERPQVSIREDIKGRILLTGLTQVDINSSEDLLRALEFGSSIRQTDATAINAKSSRSHAVFSLNLIQKKSGSQTTSRLDKRRSVPIESLASVDHSVTVDSKLHFVDLAGSERLKNTGAQGERAKEGISINAGLASLGKVIAQLSSRTHGAHVSYRDSKLTRMLQDSLGGNAITYMIACINPAEFHLSESLNTVHYAQRARAIQSKPEIQQSLSESDKVAQIERLKVEVAFLRSQISHTKGDHRHASSLDASDGRTQELQNQLLDMQENYHALSQRHERMIVELGKSTSGEDPQIPEDLLAGSATDRLQRSSSFAAAVEIVVLEYEKTIQTLESSLSNTRSTLSNTENTLMERDSRIAYLEAAAEQSQNRLRKMVDRERNTEKYLQELEGKFESVASSEESTASLVSSLRKELGRAKDTQSGTEDYVAALEQRLVDAEQDHSMMKRELERLEQVIVRQRTIVSNSVITEARNSTQPLINGGDHYEHDGVECSVRPQVRSGRADAADEQGSDPSLHDGAGILLEQNAALETTANQNLLVDEKQAAQSTFMADKLETLTQELFELRGEHETTINDFDDLKRKYAIALQSLAKLQDNDDTSQSGVNIPRSDSFLGESLPGRSLQHHGGDSSRSSSSVSSSRQGGNNSAALDDSTVTRSHELSRTDLDRMRDRSVSGEVETPITEVDVARTDEAEYTELMQNHEKLISVHREALIEVDLLKAELQRFHSERSPPPLVKSPLVRRKPSQDLIMSMSNVDRANRAFASLRNIALDHFESNPDVRQNFEMQLHTLMVELHSRTERAQQIESETLMLRKQLDEKVTIINGLTRERATFKAASTVDFSAVSLMRDQLVESEVQIQRLQETHSAQEQQFQTELAALKADLEAQINARRSQDDLTQQQSSKAGKEIEDLKAELDLWQDKHEVLLTSAKTTEAKLLATFAALRSSLTSSPLDDSRAQEPAGSPVRDVFVLDESQQCNQDDVVDKLRIIMQQHLIEGQAQAQKLSELVTVHDETLKNLDASVNAHVTLGEDLERHRTLTEDLREQLEISKAATKEHEAALEAFKETRDAELDRLRASDEGNKAREMDLQKEHQNTLDDLEQEIQKHQDLHATVLLGLSSILGQSLNHTTVQTHVQELLSAKRTLETRDIQATNDKKALEDDLATLEASNANLQDKVGELKMLHEQALKQVTESTKREEKSARLVQELEDQLSSNYDQTQFNHNRLSEMQTEKHLQLQEAIHARMELEKEVEDSRLRVGYLEGQLNELRRRSNASTAAAIALARSSSASSATMRGPSPPMDPNALPSPPPAIPLPPLPNSPIPNGFDARTVSPPPSSSRPITPHNILSATPEVNLVKQMQDQEARIRTVEKHLYAEKQLTATLEEALVDLETAQNKTRQEVDVWRRKATALEDELIGLRRERNSSSRASMQQVEEEREMRVRAEMARQALEQQMRSLEMEKRKKKGRSTLNCF
ncbi:hypothetical protein ANO11243_081060 [Dothideomycetidae sp. 11243]|nr:hypothetical protein ANO11243_081060 [fungal sp. No.11243]